MNLALRNCLIYTRMYRAWCQSHLSPFTLNNLPLLYRSIRPTQAKQTNKQLKPGNLRKLCTSNAMSANELIKYYFESFFCPPGFSERPLERLKFNRPAAFP